VTTTRIVFSDRAAITVNMDAAKVRDKLAADKDSGEPFTLFEEQGGRDVFVAADRVAYIQQISATATH